MRCPNCRSYIPEGLSSPLICPLCGKQAEPSVRSTDPTTDAMADLTSERLIGKREPSLVELSKPNAAPDSDSEFSQQAPSKAFAPYFTVSARFSFGLASALSDPSEGTISFGTDGFSFVLNEGKRWEKVSCRALTQAQLKGDSVVITIGDIESKLTIYHPWLPSFLTGAARKRRALVFLELLARVRDGLSPFEIKMYQRRLT